VRAWCGRLAPVVVSALAMLAVVPRFAGAADYRWSGSGAAGAGSWSNPANWSGGVAPGGGETIGTLAFPALTNPACNVSPPTLPPLTCGFSTNDLTGITVGTLVINDALVASPSQSYNIAGNGVTLTGGLTASPEEGANGRYGGTFALPITLGAPQTWTLSNPGPTTIGGGGLGLRAPVTGRAHALTIRVSGGASLDLSGDNEVGPLSVVGANRGRSGVEAELNGTVFLGSLGPPPSASNPTVSRLNATDAHSVTVDHAALAADGAFGPLILTGAFLTIGNSGVSAAAAIASSVTIDRRTAVLFTVPGQGHAAGTDYSQLRATGAIALGGAHLAVSVGRFQPGGAGCPTAAMGTVYTLVSTAATLTGAFDVPEGNVLTPSPNSSACRTPRFALRINYHETGSPHTVTATVVPAPPPPRPGVAGAARLSGTVLLRRPGRPRFTKLTSSARIPSGTEVDTTHGRVRLLVAATIHGGAAQADLYGGRFIFRQRPTRPLVSTFELSQPLTGCSPARAGTAAASRRRPPHARHVWVTAKGGRFNTRGQYVSTSVQGTTWLTADTCTTSFVKVTQGTVIVRDHLLHRTIVVHAGQRYTAHRSR
jgi:hypothetical protein